VKLTKIALDKRAAKAAALIFFMISSTFIFAQEASAPVAPAASRTSLSLDAMVGILVFAIELCVVLWLLINIRKLINEISGEQKVSKPLVIHLPHIFDNLNASVAIEKEKDILLDHNYDGIRELDNALPPWWKYSFYISIVWAFFYIAYYYFGGGPSSRDEYIAEVEQAKIEVEAYNKKNALNVDESHVTLSDAAGILDGQDIFKTNCAACHGNAGEGLVGPNLADDYWLHGASLSEVFKSVKYGWPAKGMKSWQADLSAVQIRNVVSYIQTLHGTNPPNAKAPEGDLYKEGGAARLDSSAVALAGPVKK
jgi:cytochrome c oxidase cbb3-type subunit III